MITPIYDKNIQEELMDIVNIQLSYNVYRQKKIKKNPSGHSLRLMTIWRRSMVNDPVIMNYHDKVIPDQRLLGTVSIL